MVYPCGFSELNLGPLARAVLNAEPSLQFSREHYNEVCFLWNEQKNHELSGKLSIRQEKYFEYDLQVCTRATVGKETVDTTEGIWCLSQCPSSGTVREGLACRNQHRQLAQWSNTEDTLEREVAHEGRLT